MEISRRARTSETPQSTQGPARGSCLVQSQGLALPWSLLIISPWIAAVAPFQKLADDAEQSAEPKPEFTCIGSQVATSNPEPPFLTLLLFSVCFEFHLSNTQKHWSEQSFRALREGGTPRHHTLSQEGTAEAMKTPPIHSFFFTQMAMVVSQEKTKSLAWEHKTGFQWGHRPGKQSRICSWLIYSCYLIISHLAVQSSLAH